MKCFKKSLLPSSNVNCVSTILGAMIILFLTMPSWGAVPQLINYQGLLTNNSGTPLKDSTYSVTFTIYDAPTGGANFWSETQPVTTSNGLFTVLLGSGPIPLADFIFSDTTRYLGIKVNPNAEFSPRSRIVSTAYSYRVGTVDGASGGTITSRLDISAQDALRIFGYQPFLTLTDANSGNKRARIQSAEGVMGFQTEADILGGLPSSVEISSLPGNSKLLVRAQDGLNTVGYQPFMTLTDDNSGFRRVRIQGANGVMGFQTEEDILGGLPSSVEISSLSGSSKLLVRAQNGLNTVGYQPFLTLTDANAGFARGAIQSVAGGLSLLTESSLSGGSEYVVLKSGTGNVGIGTPTPSVRLEVVGDLKVSGNIIGSTPWTAFPFAAGFESSGGQNVQYRKIGDMVYMRGTIKRSDNGNIGDGELFGTLPVGYRPPGTVLLYAYPGALNITPNGNIIGGYAGYNLQSLDAVIFSTSP